MALTTLGTVKALLGIANTDSSEDAALASWLAAADYAVKRYCKRDLEQTTYPAAGPGGAGDSGYYSGSDTPFLMLRETPVLSIANLWYDATGYFGQNPTGSFDATVALLSEGIDYTLRLDGCLPGTSTPCSYSGVLQRIGALWPAVRQARMGRLLPVVLPGNGNIKVQYVAGYDPIPDDLQVAVGQLVATMRRTANAGVPLQAENQGQYQYTAATAALNAMPELGSVRQLLASYRRLVI